MQKLHNELLAGAGSLSRMQPPTLRTSRLVLEPLSDRHSDGMFELWSAAEVCEHSGPAKDWNGHEIILPAVHADCSDRLIDFFVRLAEMDRGFRWAAIEAASGEFAGALGFNSLGARPELAYHQVPRFWGRGLMSEACRAALDWAQAHGAKDVVAFVDQANSRSAKLIERLGFCKSNDVREGAECYVLASSTS